MPRETMRQERLLIVVRVTRRQLQSFPARGWVAVEVFSDETAARARFHTLRLPLERLKLGAVLVHALTTPDFERVEYQKTVISKDADFWDLPQGDIVRANEEQQAQWNESVRATLEEMEAQRAAAETAAKLKRASRQAAKSRANRPALVAAAAFAVVAVVGAAMFSGSRAPAPDATLQQARRGVMTVIMADRNDPGMLVEYELKDDGSRRVVRRLTPAEAAAVSVREEGLTTQAAERPKSLVDALNNFFAVRQ